MELAALASFAILLIAWVIAPDRPRIVRTAPESVTEPMPEPIAA